MTLGLLQQPGFNAFIEWANKYNVPVEALVTINPTAATPEQIQRSVETTREKMSQATPDTNVASAQQQARDLPKPQGVTVVASAETPPNLPRQPSQQSTPTVA